MKTKKTQINEMVNNINWDCITKDSKEDFSTILNNLNLLYTNYEHVSALSENKIKNMFFIFLIVGSLLLFSVDFFIILVTVLAFKMFLLLLNLFIEKKSKDILCIYEDKVHDLLQNLTIELKNLEKTNKK